MVIRKSMVIRKRMLAFEQAAEAMKVLLANGPMESKAFNDALIKAGYKLNMRVKGRALAGVKTRKIDGRWAWEAYLPSTKR